MTMTTQGYLLQPGPEQTRKMFSPLSRGFGTLTGELDLIGTSQEKMNVPTLPELVMDDHYHRHGVTVTGTPRTRSSVSRVKTALAIKTEKPNGEMVLPKTYTTRKGALVLFTAPEEDEIAALQKLVLERKLSRLKEADVTAKFGSLSRLASSVLSFGDDNYPKDTASLSDEESKVFLKFLHDLDSRRKRGDKTLQPGGDFALYLNSLKHRAKIKTLPSSAINAWDDTKDEKISVENTEHLTKDFSRSSSFSLMSGSQNADERSVQSSASRPRQILSVEKLAASLKSNHYLGRPSPVPITIDVNVPYGLTASSSTFMSASPAPEPAMVRKRVSRMRRSISSAGHKRVAYFDLKGQQRPKTSSGVSHRVDQSGNVLSNEIYLESTSENVMHDTKPSDVTSSTPPSTQDESQFCLLAHTTKPKDAVTLGDLVSNDSGGIYSKDPNTSSELVSNESASFPKDIKSELVSVESGNFHKDPNYNSTDISFEENSPTKVLMHEREMVDLEVDGDIDKYTELNDPNQVQKGEGQSDAASVASSLLVEQTIDIAQGSQDGALEQEFGLDPYAAEEWNEDMEGEEYDYEEMFEEGEEWEEEVEDENGEHQGAIQPLMPQYQVSGLLSGQGSFSLMATTAENADENIIVEDPSGTIDQYQRAQSSASGRRTVNSPDLGSDRPLSQASSHSGVSSERANTVLSQRHLGNEIPVTVDELAKDVSETLRKQDYSTSDDESKNKSRNNEEVKDRPKSDASVKTPEDLKGLDTRSARKQSISKVSEKAGGQDEKDANLGNTRNETDSSTKDEKTPKKSVQIALPTNDKTNTQKVTEKKVVSSPAKKTEPTKKYVKALDIKSKEPPAPPKPAPPKPKPKEVEKPWKAKPAKPTKPKARNEPIFSSPALAPAPPPTAKQNDSPKKEKKPLISVRRDSAPPKPSKEEMELKQLEKDVDNILTSAVNEEADESDEDGQGLTAEEMELEAQILQEKLKKAEEKMKSPEPGKKGPRGKSPPGKGAGRKGKKKKEEEEEPVDLELKRQALKEAKKLEKQRRLEEAKLLEEKKKEKEAIREAKRKEKAKKVENLKEEMADMAQISREAEEAEADARVAMAAGRKAAKEEREARRKAEQDRKKEERTRKKENEKKMMEAAKKKEREMLEKIMDAEQQRMLREDERRQREEEEEKERLKEEEEEMMARRAAEEEEERIQELERQAEEEALVRLVTERDEAETRRRRLLEEAERLKEEEERERARQLEEEQRLAEEQRLKELEEQRQQEEERLRLLALKRMEEEAREKFKAEVDKRRDAALKRREQNLERRTHLHGVRQSQGLTKPWVFSYYVMWPRETYEARIGGDDKKKKGFRPKPKPKAK